MPMKILFIAALLLLVRLDASAEEAALTPAADAAVTKYSTEVSKADAERDKRVEAAKVVLIQTLQREMEVQTKAGKLDNAIAIRAKIEAVKQGSDGKDADSGLLGNGSSTTTEGGIKIPNLPWQPLGKTGVRSALMLGPFPKGTEPGPIQGYLAAGEFKKGYLGVSVQKLSVDGSGNFNCINQDNSDTYWLVYVKAAGKQPVEVLLTGQANPADHTNASELYFDGKVVQSGSKVTVTPSGHAIVLRQIHNAAYLNAWIRLLAEQPVMIAP